jgi:hypothetical protein
VYFRESKNMAIEMTKNQGRLVQPFSAPDPLFYI